MIVGEIKRFFGTTEKIKASRSLKTEIYTLGGIQEQLSMETDARPYS